MGENRRNSAVDTVVRQLAELTGTRPRVFRESTGVRVEFDITAQAESRWREVLEILERGLGFGMSDSSQERTAWLRMGPESGAHGGVEGVKGGAEGNSESPEKGSAH